MHACELVGYEASGISLKSEGNQIEHGVNQLARGFIVRIQAKPLGIHFWSGDLEP